ncbi:hypothetical protein BJX99DRAFT_207909 [Aspergillus californicus]
MQSMGLVIKVENRTVQWRHMRGGYDMYSSLWFGNGNHGKWSMSSPVNTHSLPSIMIAGFLQLLPGYGIRTLSSTIASRSELQGEDSSMQMMQQLKLRDGNVSLFVGLFLSQPPI